MFKFRKGETHKDEEGHNIYTDYIAYNSKNLKEDITVRYWFYRTVDKRCEWWAAINSWRVGHGWAKSIDSSKRKALKAIRASPSKWPALYAIHTAEDAVNAILNR